MPEETDEIVGSLGRELVSDLAPEELPLYPSLLGQFEGAKRGRGKKDSVDIEVIVRLLDRGALRLDHPAYQALCRPKA
jgi:hypothetical protein